MISMLYVGPLFRNLDGISSRKYIKSPPSFKFTSNRQGVQNPFNLNVTEGNESCGLFSEKKCYVYININDKR